MGDAKNQCMGCQAGWRLMHAHHPVADGYPHELVSCTAGHYVEADRDHWRTRAEQAEAGLQGCGAGMMAIEHVVGAAPDGLIAAVKSLKARAEQAERERDALVERIAALEARIADLTPTVDCGACGLAMPISTIVADDDELTCHGCGACNRLAVDINEVYVAHYVCRHGVDPEDAECETCANAPDKGEP